MRQLVASETCDKCGTSFDGQSHRHAVSTFAIDPFVRRDGQFTVRCPACGNQFVSENVRFLGLVTRKTFFPFLFFLLPTLVLVAVLALRLITRLT